MKKLVTLTAALLLSFAAQANIKFMPTKVDLTEKPVSSFRILNSFDDKIDFMVSVVDEKGQDVQGVVAYYPKILTSVGDAEVKLKRTAKPITQEKLYLKLQSISTPTPIIFQVRVYAD